MLCFHELHENKREIHGLVKAKTNLRSLFPHPRVVSVLTRKSLASVPVFCEEGQNKRLVAMI